MTISHCLNESLTQTISTIALKIRLAQQSQRKIRRAHIGAF